MTSLFISRRAFIASSVGAGIVAAGCESSSSGTSTAQAPQTNLAKRNEIDAGIDGAVAELNQKDAGSRAIMQQAKGMLVFPKVFKAGLVVGGEYGEGALRIAGRSVDYYSASAGSIGLTAGAEQKSVFLLFMTDAALAQFRQSSGWTAGADASVAMVNVGASGQATTQTTQRPVIGYVLSQGGLMLDASLNGTKVSKLAI